MIKAMSIIVRNWDSSVLRTHSVSDWACSWAWPWARSWTRGHPWAKSWIAK
jgi:hypothetical protein